MITILFGRAAQFLLALAMMRVATTLLSPAEMGKVSLVVTTTAFFALFLVNPVGMFINRRLHSWQASGAARHYLSRYVCYLTAVAVISAVCLPLLYHGGVTNFGVPLDWLIGLVCGSLLLNTINQTSIPSLNLLGSSGSFVLLSVATIAASFAAAVALVHWEGSAAQHWLLGLLVGQGALGIIGTKVLFDRLRRAAVPRTTPAIGAPHLRMLAAFAWPVAIAAGLGWIQAQGYRYLVESHLGLAQLGLFVAGYGISAGVIAGFESVLTAYFQPRLYRDVNAMPADEKARAWRRYATAVMPSTLVTVALITGLAPELTRFFLGAKFQSAAEYVMWGAFAEAMRVLIAIYSLIAHVHMRTRWLILPGLVGALTSIPLCLLLIREFGASGAGMGLTASGLTVVLTMHLLLAQHVGGGALKQPLLLAGLLALGLWGTAAIVRILFVPTGWGALVAPLGVTGLMYFGLQYYLLRPNFVDPTPAST